MSLSHPWSRILVAYIAVFAGGVLACRSATEVPNSQLTIATDRPLYHITSGDVVNVRLVNRGPELIYTEMPSFNVSLQMQRDYSWIDLGPFWYGIYDIAPRLLVLGAGDSLQSIPLSTLSSGLRGPGQYRFLYTLYRDSALREVLPLEARVSNVFDIAY